MTTLEIVWHEYGAEHRESRKVAPAESRNRVRREVRNLSDTVMV
jgi:hypothetical protein